MIVESHLGQKRHQLQGKIIFYGYTHSRAWQHWNRHSTWQH